MKLFVVTDHNGVYPVGTASVIVAESESEARALLDTELIERGLLLGYTIRELPLDKSAAYVLRDGNY